LAPTIGTISVACALGCLDYRFATMDWRAKHPKLYSIAKTPAMVATQPPAAQSLVAARRQTRSSPASARAPADRAFAESHVGYKVRHLRLLRPRAAISAVRKSE
jgi:hypothetical protein